MYSALYSAAAAVLLVGQTNALVTRANLPPKFTVSDIGIQSSNFANVYRDGGSGGTVNGLNLITFSDTTTTNGGTTGSMKGFTDNSVAYMGQNGAAINKLTDFGANGVPNMSIPFQKNESDYTTQHFSKDGTRCVLWPQGSIATLADGKTGVAVYPVGIYGGSNAGNLYNTLVTVTADPAKGPTFERAVPQLFYQGEPLYGVFSTIVSHETPGELFLFSSEFDSKTLAGGMRVAKVDATKYKDRSQYQYWTGSAWSSNIKDGQAPSGLLFGASLSTGDVFWNDYYKTYMVVYFNGFASNTFYLRYSLDGTVTGKWSDEITLQTTQGDPSNKGETYNYAGHAYPTLDTTGKTLTLSYTKAGGQYTEMMKVTFN